MIAAAPREVRVRIEDASLVPDGGPARLAISHLERAGEVGDAIASAGGVTRLTDAYLHVVAVPSRIVAAAGRVGGRELADALEATLETATESWLGPPPDLVTRAGTLPCTSETVVMGILNVTPDSFSDGGVHFDPDRPRTAVEWGLALSEAGAHVIDVGGESSRPDATAVAEDEELRRVIPVIEELAAAGLVVSIDTTKAAVARAACEAGAAIVNDVSAGLIDGLLLATVVELDVPYVIMHMRGTPRTMQREPAYHDVVGEVFDFLADQFARVVHMGLSPDRVVLDPGIGFGKTPAHNLTLLRRLRDFTSLGRPVLVGASRKSFLGAITGVEQADDRVHGSLAAATLAVANGASIVRVHDVSETVRAAAVARAVATANEASRPQP